eukprot:366480-Chlamydomonas_euryale.AAC.6
MDGSTEESLGSVVVEGRCKGSVTGRSCSNDRDPCATDHARACAAFFGAARSVDGWTDEWTHRRILESIVQKAWQDTRNGQAILRGGMGPGYVCPGSMAPSSLVWVTRLMGC